MALAIEDVVLAYVAAWNENDAAARRMLLDMCWADNGSVTSPYEHFVGREALFHSIDTFRRACPDDRAILTSGIDHHHGWFRFTGIVVRLNGTTYSEVLDIGEIGPVDGLIGSSPSTDRCLRLVRSGLTCPPSRAGCRNRRDSVSL